jgi:hypothetical protein
VSAGMFRIAGLLFFVLYVASAAYLSDVLIATYCAIVSVLSGYVNTIAYQVCIAVAPAEQDLTDTDSRAALSLQL